MYCSACATPLPAGLSYCNRCGMNLKERTEPSPTVVGSYLTSITVIGVGGLGVMLGGAIAMKNGAQLPVDIIGIFMLMCFFVVALVEIFLCRQLSRISRNLDQKQLTAPVMPAALPADFRAQQRALAEPVPSVTENTTRTLEYSRKEPSS